MRLLALAGAIVVLSGTAAHAQVVINIPDASSQTITCQTSICRQATRSLNEPVYNRPSYENRATCVAANTALGRWISAAAFFVTTKQRDGALNYDQAADIRSLLYTETFVLQRRLREILPSGDVARCEGIKDQAIEVVNQIIRQSFGYDGPATTQGPAYGRSR